MARIIFKLNSVSDDEADDIRSLLAENDIDFFESPPGNWGVSMHALWLKDESRYARAKQLIDEYQEERSQRARLETRQRIERGEQETLIQRMLQRPLQFLLTLAIILFILYVSIIPFLEFGQA